MQAIATFDNTAEGWERSRNPRSSGHQLARTECGA
jgi:hypothetical protein